MSSTRSAVLHSCSGCRRGPLAAASFRSFGSGLIFALFFAGDYCLAERLSFENGWLEVQRVDDGLAADRFNVDRSRLVREAARNLYLPQVDLTGSYIRLDDPVEVDFLDFNPLAAVRSSDIGSDIIDLLGGDAAFTTDFTNESLERVSVKALWPVYTGGRIAAAQDIAGAQVDIAQQLLDLRRRTTFGEFARVYYGAVLATQNLDTLRRAENGLLLHLNNANEMEQQGLISKVERLSVEAAHDRSTVATAKAERALEIAQRTLQEFMHRQSTITPADQLFVNKHVPAVEVFIEVALENSPIVKALDAQRTEASAVLKAEKGRFHPDVFLFADYAVHEDNSIAASLIPDWQVGIGVSFVLVDRLDRGKSVGATRKAQDTIDSLRDEAERELVIVTRVLHGEMLQSLQEHDGLQSSLQLAQENLTLRQEAFSQGLSTSVDVVDAELFLAAIRTQRSAAAYKYVVSLAELLALTGDMRQFGSYRGRGTAGQAQTGATP